MTNFVLIILCISVGMIMSKLRILPKDSHKSLNAWILYVALPALSLRYIPEIDWNVQIILSALSPVLVWIGAWIFVALYVRNRPVDPTSRTALLLTCGLGNTGFLGLPMVAGFYGEGEIHHAIIFDQVTFLLFSTLAVIVVLQTANGKENVSALYIVRKVFRFPPFIASIAALILPSFIDLSVANPLLDKLVYTMSPMALFSIGLQMKFGEWKKESGYLLAGLSYKLIIAPAIVLLLALAMNGTGNLAQITIFEAAMPSHITASLLASQYNMNPRLCTLMVGIGIVLGFITCTFWWFVGNMLF